MQRTTVYEYRANIEHCYIKIKQKYLLPQWTLLVECMYCFDPDPSTSELIHTTELEQILRFYRKLKKVRNIEAKIFVVLFKAL